VHIAAMLQVGKRPSFSDCLWLYVINLHLSVVKHRYYVMQMQHSMTWSARARGSHRRGQLRGEGSPPCARRSGQQHVAARRYARSSQLLQLSSQRSV